MLHVHTHLKNLVFTWIYLKTNSFQQMKSFTFWRLLTKSTYFSLNKLSLEHFWVYHITWFITHVLIPNEGMFIVSFHNPLKYLKINGWLVLPFFKHSLFINNIYKFTISLDNDATYRYSLVYLTIWSQANWFPSKSRVYLSQQNWVMQCWM